MKAGPAFAALLLAVLPPGWAAASGDAAGKEAAVEILSRLDARLAGMTTMKGRFVQTFTSAGLGVPQSESGRFYLSRPDRMRWDYASPEKKVAVSDGLHTWLYLPEEETVYRGSVDSWKKGGAFALLAGGSLRAEYDAIGVEATGARKGNIVLSLKPRVQRDEFGSVLVEVNPADLTLASVTAVDGMGNRIAALFTDVEENVRLDPGLFTFSPPPRARVIDQESPSSP